MTSLFWQGFLPSFCVHHYICLLFLTSTGDLGRRITVRGQRRRLCKREGLDIDLRSDGREHADKSKESTWQHMNPPV